MRIWGIEFMLLGLASKCLYLLSHLTSIFSEYKTIICSNGNPTPLGHNFFHSSLI
ncbi:hypothetical protein I79_020358 [Cricetulus griseus]|uniref:Uncharacterized protein n=1 Tax=Cricetulus griseus TaxID=10029 RepID=G3I9U8_CRIGR|nr:hypothetical protein I79_020358 [Cricetulus griseus]